MATIDRIDLMSKHQFSKAYKVSKPYLDKIIFEDRLNCERIAGITYISILDEETIQEALRGRQRPGTWSRNTVIRLKKPKPGSFDAKFDEAFEQYEREHS
jgi:hypothetical protein